MPDYLISRPGRPLHLALWVQDRAEHQHSWYHSGRHAPLCGLDYGARWTLTGPYAEKWPEQKRGGLCLHCEKVLDVLFVAADQAPTRVRGAR